MTLSTLNQFLADRTATQYDQLLASSYRPVVYKSIRAKIMKIGCEQIVI